MIRIGVTGNIGSGKSLVCSIFEILDIAVYYADDEAKKILDSQAVHSELQFHFGSKIFSDNRVNRPLLASIVFQSSEELHFLNSVIHPRLKKDIQSWFEKQNENPYAIVEAAILFENSFDSLFDKTIMITAPQNIRLERVLKRDNVKPEEVLNRMQHQWSEEKKMERSDFVIYNDGKQMLIPQLIELDKMLRTLS